MGELKDCPVCHSQAIIFKRQYRRIFCECERCHYAGYSSHFKLGARVNWNNEEYRQRAVSHGRKKK